MSKIYDLYPSYEQKIDKWRKRILGYEKMKRDMQRQIQILKNKNKKQKEVIDKAIEYLTSYSSIHTIQFGTENDSLNDIELNKALDEKTLNEMTNRYLKVHDKLLDILKEESE